MKANDKLLNILGLTGLRHGRVSRAHATISLFSAGLEVHVEYTRVPPVGSDYDFERTISQTWLQMESCSLKQFSLNL